VPLSQFYMARTNVLVRLADRSRPGTDGLPLLTDALSAIDPDVPVFRIESLEEHVGATLAQERALAVLLAAFGVLPVLLSLGGLYSVLAYATETRTREFGIRMAVGADRRRVAALVLRQGMALSGVGFAVGLLGSLLAAGLLEGLLFGVEPEDPWTLAAVGGLTLLAGAFGAFAPARAATRVDPMETLRSE
jgi:ABC-type antimicrobial peptide transport system permease subunit